MYARGPQHLQGKWRKSDFLLAQCSLASIIIEAGLRMGIRIPVFGFYLDRMTGHRACNWEISCVQIVDCIYISTPSAICSPAPFTKSIGPKSTVALAHVPLVAILFFG